jgi:hypothetical protein
MAPHAARKGPGRGLRNVPVNRQQVFLPYPNQLLPTTSYSHTLKQRRQLRLPPLLFQKVGAASSLNDVQRISIDFTLAKLEIQRSTTISCPDDKPPRFAIRRMMDRAAWGRMEVRIRAGSSRDHVREAIRSILRFCSAKDNRFESREPTSPHAFFVDGSLGEEEVMGPCLVSETTTHRPLL